MPVRTTLRTPLQIGDVLVDHEGRPVSGRIEAIMIIGTEPSTGGGPGYKLYRFSDHKCLSFGQSYLHAQIENGVSDGRRITLNGKDIKDKLCQTKL